MIAASVRRFLLEGLRDVIVITTLLSNSHAARVVAFNLLLFFFRCHILMMHLIILTNFFLIILFFFKVFQGCSHLSLLCEAIVQSPLCRRVKSICVQVIDLANRAKFIIGAGYVALYI